MIRRFINNPYFISFLIFLVNFLFKEYRAGITGLSYDECFSAYFAQASVGEIIKFSETDPNPPLYLIILHYWIDLFGDSEYAIRMLSVLANSAAAALFYLFCRRFFNWQTGIFAALMYLTSNEIYYYSQEARTYSIILAVAISSYYFYLSLLQSPKTWKYIALGCANAVLFYLHYISTFIVVAQILLFPILAARFSKSIEQPGDQKTFLISINRKQCIYFLASLIIFLAILFPWLDRFLQLFGDGGKSFWLAKPTYREFKDCLYDFFNSKTLFNVYLFTFLLCLVLVTFFHKLREQNSNCKLLLFALAIGPALIFIIYLGASLSPIFLKRYVLFTLPGFILTFAYTLSILRINFFIKLTLFAGLSIWSLTNMSYPRPASDQYNKAAWFFKKVKQPDTFVTNDLQDLLSYYYERRFFAVREYHVKRLCLLAKGIYTPYNNEWPKTEDLSKYRVIYYTQTFASSYDPNNLVLNSLNSQFQMVKEIRFYRGIEINVFYNSKYTGAKLD